MSDNNNTPPAPFEEFFVSGLFNTELSDTISPEFMADINSQRRHIDPSNLRYPVLPAALPKVFDPRSVDGFPASEIPNWFFKDWKGNWNTVLSIPLDQAGCGSCWAFSTASQFSDVIRINLLKRYKEKACISSRFFHPAFICTGDSEIGSNEGKGGVVNVNKVKLYGQEIRDQISCYFTVAFSPKFDGKGGIDNNCAKALDEWKATISSANRAPKDLQKIFGSAAEYSKCMGCQGNLIVCPLMLFTGATEEAKTPEGAPLIIDFPIHEWACLWGNKQLKDRFCAEETLAGTITFDFPKLYKCDSYSYVTAKDFAKPANRVAGITSMSQWMMASIYNYGTITIGFSVYKSFMTFFSKPENAKAVYTAADFKKGSSEKALGGHAVVIVGWAQDPVPNWIVRNSWGVKFADGGYFRVERDIDAKLNISAKLNFENEFGALYFSPGPNPNAYASDNQNNEMKEYLMPVPRIKCPALGEHPELADEMSKHCSCRCDEYWDKETKACKHVAQIQYPVALQAEIEAAKAAAVTDEIAPTITALAGAPSAPVRTAGTGTPLLFILLLLFAMIFLFCFVIRYFTPRTPSERRNKYQAKFLHTCRQ
jgi:hypothetical protein